MNEAAFNTAVAPEPVAILGVRLRPFCVGHAILLARIRSPFIDGGNAGAGDLLAAVVICSMPFAEGLEAVTGDDLEREVSAWGRRITRRGWRVWRAPEPLNLFAAMEVFRSYVEDAGESPEYSFEDKGERAEFGSPWAASLLATLCAEFGMSFTEAVNLPLPLARWLVLARREGEGALRVVDKHETAALRREADAIAAEVFAA